MVITAHPRQGPSSFALVSVGGRSFSSEVKSSITVVGPGGALGFFGEQSCWKNLSRNWEVRKKNNKY